MRLALVWVLGHAPVLWRARAELLAAYPVHPRGPAQQLGHGLILEHLEHHVLAEVYAASRVPTLIVCP